MCPESQGKQENNRIVIGKKPALIALQPKDEAAVELGRDQLMSPLSIFFPFSFLSAGCSIFNQLAFLWHVFIESFGFHGDLIWFFSFGALLGKGIDNKINKKSGLGRWVVLQSKKKEKKRKMGRYSLILLQWGLICSLPVCIAITPEIQRPNLAQIKSPSKDVIELMVGPNNEIAYN